ncbi:DNA damage-inducible protein YebG [Shigella sonnei]|nr:DNA damage-inducible protein YebG [Shigella sonnei]
MAVEVKYVVIREGEEKMSFTSKKEADAYDKMLDTADLLVKWSTKTGHRVRVFPVSIFRFVWG